MKTIRCGVIGLGRLGYRHAAHLHSRIPGSHLCCVADSSGEALNAFCSEYEDVKPYHDYERLLADPNIDAVIIATSTATHATIAKAALRSQKAVFCEKPLSLEFEQAKELAQMIKEQPTFFQVGFMRRFDSAYRDAFAQIESGKMGKAISLRSCSRDPSCPPVEFAKSSGGLIMDLCIHDLDLCRWFSKSEAVEVYARGGVIRYPELGRIGDLDHVDISIRFANGFLATVEGSRNSRYGYDVRTEVVTTEGALFIGPLGDSSLQACFSSGMYKAPIDGFLTRFEQAYYEELVSFIDHLREGKEPSVTVEDALRAQLLAQAAQKSLERNRPVLLA